MSANDFLTTCVTIFKPWWEGLGKWCRWYFGMLREDGPWFIGNSRLRQERSNLEVTYPISLAADQKPIIRVLFIMNLTTSALFLGVAACKLFDRGLEIIWALPLITHFSNTLGFAVAHNALSMATDKLEMLKFLIFSICVTLVSGTATLLALFGYNEIHFAIQNCLCLFYLISIILRLIQVCWAVHSFSCLPAKYSTFAESFQVPFCASRASRAPSGSTIQVPNEI